MDIMRLTGKCSVRHSVYMDFKWIVFAKHQTFLTKQMVRFQ